MQKRSEEIRSISETFRTSGSNSFQCASGECHGGDYFKVFSKQAPAPMGAFFSKAKRTISSLERTTPGIHQVNLQNVIPCGKSTLVQNEYVTKAHTSQ